MFDAVVEIIVVVRSRAADDGGTGSGAEHDRHDCRSRRRYAGAALPGVTVNAESPNLQGIRTAVTSENGDYIFTLLPSGAYTVTFELSGFQRVAADRHAGADAGAAGRSDDGAGRRVGDRRGRRPDGRRADADRAGGAPTSTQELIATLPTNRDINAALLLAPAVHPTGPGGNYSIAGSMSFENLFMVNGVTVNENLRGQANDLYIEDAIQETTVATAGVSAEYGRFSGGVVNVVTKSGGNLFSGSFRETLNNDNWRTLRRRSERRRPVRATTPNASTRSCRPRVHVRRADRQGPAVVLHRRAHPDAGEGRQLVRHEHPLHLRPTRRSATRARAPTRSNSNHRFQGAYTKIIDEQMNNTFNTSTSMDLNSLYDRETPQDLFTVNYSGVLTPKLFVEAAISQRNFTFVGVGAQDHRPHRRHADDRQRARPPLLVGDVLRRLHPEKRDNQDIFVKGSYFLSTERRRVAQHDLRLRQLQRHPQRQQPPVGQRLPHPPRPARSSRAPDVYPLFLGRRHDASSSGTRSRSTAGIELPDPLGVLQRQLARQRPR